ncbi:FtsB family cell division protein [Ornithinicoccus hortensis]|uniref:Cell division protein FtsB n=1 Tax=Ornithinicoccus hortensis TaxID=82346 RepID=A0A542YVG8_9MICO|nr:septum formation initiator family protein [Ornithinicoccus hortensis]TQL52081.1 cell division protein FtsB [Ornithinicoccus hortensis]
MASSRGPGRGGANRPAPRSRDTRQRAGTRPATGAPVRPQGTTRAARRTAPPHVWRLGILVVLLAFLALFLTPTLRGYIEQRSDITRMEQAVAREEHRIAELQADVEAWKEPETIEREARDRLRFVKPGETAFTVLDDTEEQVTEPLPGMAGVTTDVHEHRPWYGEVWESVVSANEGVPEVDGAGQR